VAGGRYSVVGYQNREFVFGKVVSRTDNGQPARLVAAGVAFPQDLRRCDACHGDAPQAGEQVAAISRRTCQGCHPDAWFGSGGTDQVHFAHAGGPQPDDTQCAGCHIQPTPSQLKLYAPIADLHRAPPDSPSWNGLTAAIVGVENLKPGMNPTVTFTLADRVGVPTPLGSPTPAADAASPASPVPRALERVALTLSGPTAPDYLTSNAVDGAGLLTAPVTEVVPLATAADGSGYFRHTFTATVPAGATGTWAVSLEARRRAAVRHYLTTSDTPSDTFPWPGTGETVIEWAGNPVAFVDTALGTSGAGSPVARRQVVEQARCEKCHQRLSLHGGLRHDLEYCLMCHTADRTDRTQRPKGADGNVRLASTWDGLEERSVHFKVMVHRIHTGARKGRAELTGIEPYVIYGFGGNSFFFDEVEFPGDLRDCRLCHAGETFAVQSVPADAAATVANEAGSILHAGTAVHPASEPRTPPIQAACLGCHATGPARLHASKYTTSAGEQCRSCHGGRGTLSAYGAHGLTPPAP
jgi:OmcA/MtrC family decaheme c-type cytochrome